jgi:hypothetical protein
MAQAPNVAQDDRFQILREHSHENVTIDANYLGINKSADASSFRSLSMADTRAEAILLQKRHRRPASARPRASHDVFINLVEVKENWSFGHREAEYA